MKSMPEFSNGFLLEYFIDYWTFRLSLVDFMVGEYYQELGVLCLKQTEDSFPIIILAKSIKFRNIKWWGCAGYCSGKVKHMSFIVYKAKRVFHGNISKVGVPVMISVYKEMSW